MSLADSTETDNNRDAMLSTSLDNPSEEIIDVERTEIEPKRLSELVSNLEVINLNITFNFNHYFNFLF